MFDKEHYKKFIIEPNKKNSKKNLLESKLEVKCLNLPGITKEFAFIKELTELENDDDLFKNDSVEFILAYKWKCYGRKKFMKECFIQLFIMITYYIKSIVITPN